MKCYKIILKDADESIYKRLFMSCVSSDMSFVQKTNPGTYASASTVKQFTRDKIVKETGGSLEKASDAVFAYASTDMQTLCDIAYDVDDEAYEVHSSSLRSIAEGASSTLLSLSEKCSSVIEKIKSSEDAKRVLEAAGYDSSNTDGLSISTFLKAVREVSKDAESGLKKRAAFSRPREEEPVEKQAEREKHAELMSRDFIDAMRSFSQEARSATSYLWGYSKSFNSVIRTMDTKGKKQINKTVVNSSIERVEPDETVMWMTESEAREKRRSSNENWIPYEPDGKTAPMPFDAAGRPLTQEEAKRSIDEGKKVTYKKLYQFEGYAGRTSKGIISYMRPVFSREEKELNPKSVSFGAKKPSQQEAQWERAFYSSADAIETLDQYASIARRFISAPGREAVKLVKTGALREKSTAKERRVRQGEIAASHFEEEDGKMVERTDRVADPESMYVTLYHVPLPKFFVRSIYKQDYSSFAENCKKCRDLYDEVYSSGDTSSVDKLKEVVSDILKQVREMKSSAESRSTSMTSSQMMASEEGKTEEKSRRVKRSFFNADINSNARAVNVNRDIVYSRKTEGAERGDDRLGMMAMAIGIAIDMSIWFTALLEETMKNWKEPSTRNELAYVR